MIKKVSKNLGRKRRHVRVRKKITGNEQRPRLCVFRSLTNIYAQVIDDSKGHTLASASSLDAEIKGKVKTAGNIDAAKLVGALVGKRAKEKGITAVVFDRGGNLYHGRVKELAESARGEGLEF